jgi:hypothetical protein
MRLIAVKKGLSKGESILGQTRSGTHWLNAIIWGFVFAFMYGDSIIVQNVKFAPWGEAAIFFAVFFISIFLDRRTRFRGIMALVASVDLGVFYLVYSRVP